VACRTGPGLDVVARRNSRVGPAKPPRRDLATRDGSVGPEVRVVSAQGHRSEPMPFPRLLSIEASCAPADLGMLARNPTTT